MKLAVRDIDGDQTAAFSDKPELFKLRGDLFFVVKTHPVQHYLTIMAFVPTDFEVKSFNSIDDWIFADYNVFFLDLF